MSIALECELESRAEYRLGDPILLTCRLRNAGERDVFVLVWNTFLGTRVSGDFLRVTFQGRPVRYVGPLVSRRDPSAGSYVRIAAGDVATAEVDVAALYAIDRPGDYEVSSAMRLQDVFESNGAVPPRRKADHHMLRLASSPVILHVQPGLSPQSTGPRVAAEEDTKSPASLERSGTSVTAGLGAAPTIVGTPTQNQINEIHTAHNWGQTAAGGAQTAITSSAHGGEDAVALFGSYDPTRYGRVAGCYQAMMQDLAGPTPVTYNLIDRTVCGVEDADAWTHGDGDGVIYLCSEFFQSSSNYVVDDAYQAEVVVHEWSHNFGGTTDIVYGQVACALLAQTCPDQAAENADSYGYYAMAVADSEPEPDNGIWQPDKTTPADKTVTTPALAVWEGPFPKPVLMLAYAGTDGNLWSRLGRFGDVTPWDGTVATPVRDANENTLFTKLGPALAQLSGLFCCVFVDTSTGNSGPVKVTVTSDLSQSWSPPVTLGTLTTAMQPALVADTTGTMLLCVAADATGTLQSCQITVSGTTVSATPWTAGNKPITNVLTPPALTVFGSAFYCLCAYGPAPYLGVCYSSNGQDWTFPGLLPDEHIYEACGLASFYGEMVVVFRRPDDNHLRYIATSDGSKWSLDYRESSNSAGSGVAVVGNGSALYAAYRSAQTDHKAANYNSVYWSSAEGDTRSP